MKSWLRKQGYTEKIVYQEFKNWTFWSHSVDMAEVRQVLI